MSHTFMLVPLFLLSASPAFTDSRPPAGQARNVKDASAEAALNTARAQVQFVGGVIEAYQARNGTYPPTLLFLTQVPRPKLRLPNLKDVWAQDLRFRVQGSEGFALCSNGPDKRPGTRDDICYGEIGSGGLQIEGAGKNGGSARNADAPTRRESQPNSVPIGKAESARLDRYGVFEPTKADVIRVINDYC